MDFKRNGWGPYPSLLRAMKDFSEKLPHPNAEALMSWYCALCSLDLKGPGDRKWEGIGIVVFLAKEASIDFVENHDGARTPPLDPRALRSRIAGVGGRVADGF